MLTEAEILVHLGHRIPGHACTSYFGIFQGLNRNQRRRADWENMQEWKVYYRECEYNRQIKRQIRFVNARGATDAQMQERWKGRLFLDPLELFFVIARTRANHSLLYKRGYLPFWFLEIVEKKRGPCWALPWPLRGMRRLSRWQLPPKGRKYRRPGGPVEPGGLVDDISAMNVFPVEWRPKDSYDVMMEDDI